MTQRTEAAPRRDLDVANVGAEETIRAPAPVERTLTAVRRLTPTMLRLSLAVVFVWFGALKVFDVSPVTELVADTLPMFDGSVVYLLGAFEILLGVALAVGNHPVVGATVALHLAGTFLVLVVQPEVAFQDGNPLLLTTEGEFIMKNLVLIAAALGVVGLSGGNRSPRPRPRYG